MTYSDAPFKLNSSSWVTTIYTKAIVSVLKFSRLETVLCFNSRGTTSDRIFYKLMFMSEVVVASIQIPIKHQTTRSITLLRANYTNTVYFTQPGT